MKQTRKTAWNLIILAGNHQLLIDLGLLVIKEKGFIKLYAFTKLVLVDNSDILVVRVWLHALGLSVVSTHRDVVKASYEVMFTKVMQIGTCGHFEFALGTLKLKGEDTG